MFLTKNEQQKLKEREHYADGDKCIGTNLKNPSNVGNIVYMLVHVQISSSWLHTNNRNLTKEPGNNRRRKMESL